jgi:hypothetical protein
MNVTNQTLSTLRYLASILPLPGGGSELGTSGWVPINQSTRISKSRLIYEESVESDVRSPRSSSMCSF